MKLHYTDNGDETITLDESLWWFDAKTGALVCAEKGFTCDITSTPQISQCAVPKWGKHNRGAIFHDKLYSSLGRVGTQVLSRADCDRIFWEIMKEDGVSWWIRHRAWLGVRLFGWAAWNEHKRKQAQTSEVV